MHNYMFCLITFIWSYQAKHRYTYCTDIGISWYINQLHMQCQLGPTELERANIINNKKIMYNMIWKKATHIKTGAGTIHDYPSYCEATLKNKGKTGKYQTKTKDNNKRTQKSMNQCIFNSLWPSDAIWQHRCGSTLAQVMACCMTAPSHYLNQCWLIISKV